MTAMTGGVGHSLEAPEDLVDIVCPAGIMVGSVLSGGAHLGSETERLVFLDFSAPRLPEAERCAHPGAVPGVLRLSEEGALRAAVLVRGGDRDGSPPA